ncbi:tyrosine-type recombinase/integrase [Streptomyces pseudovenezuelae]|uniref:tyrosine-type recombinase/integrase n=1 Tax=Streptomyces pseudovenezuelae TaxID=67350 RepID=UPI0036EDBFC3
MHWAGFRRIRFHGLRHSTATLLLEQGVELIVIRELLGQAHIGGTATVYAHVRLRLQRDAIDTLSAPLGHRQTPSRPTATTTTLRRPHPLTLPSATEVFSSSF